VLPERSIQPRDGTRELQRHSGGAVSQAPPQVHRLQPCNAQSKSGYAASMEGSAVTTKLHSRYTVSEHVDAVKRMDGALRTSGGGGGSSSAGR
jgi:hypothetical protein